MPTFRNDNTVPGAGRFTGIWKDRLGGVLECGVDFQGQSVLDIGCNMGIVSYEISKQNPRFIRGIDIDADSINIARRIFRGVNVQSEFLQLDLGDIPKVEEAMDENYDIILYLAVHHHIRKQSPEAAEFVSKLLLEKCKNTIIYRGSRRCLGLFKDFAKEIGFEITYEQDRQNINPAIRFDRKAG